MVPFVSNTIKHSVMQKHTTANCALLSPISNNIQLLGLVLSTPQVTHSRRSSRANSWDHRRRFLWDENCFHCRFRRKLWPIAICSFLFSAAWRTEYPEVFKICLLTSILAKVRPDDHQNLEAYNFPIRSIQSQYGRHTSWHTPSFSNDHNCKVFADYETGSTPAQSR